MSQEGRLKIAFVADSIHTQAGGGVLSGEYVVAKLRREHDVVTVATDGDDVLPALPLPIAAMQRMHFIMAKPDRRVLAHAFAWVDVVHLQLPFWLSFAALDVARRFRLPVVAAFHVQPENALLNVGISSAWLNAFIYRELVDHFYNRVDAVLCPTEFAAQKLRDHGLSARTAVISNGVPPDVALAMAAAPARHDPSGRFFLLAVGRFAAEKRQEVIVEAVRRCRHRGAIHLVLCGWGPREEELKALAASLPNGADVGFVSRAELLEDYTAADLFVHAGEVELEGMSVLEAMSAGVPALVADAPESAASRLALNDDFRFPAGDATALAAKIDALLDDPARLAQARGLYRERAKQFDFDASVGKLVELYRSLVRRAPLERETA
jgi:1,2-diacylglycerol 3-alpha-glucosyltransferase